jgi:hypothetical protein
VANENTQEKRKGEHLVPYQFQPGNPGRPKGSRNKLAEDFLSDVLGEWQSHGKVAISDMRKKNPGDFVKMVASLLPKDINLNLTDNLSELSDDELLGEIRKLHASLAPLLASGTDAATVEAIATRVH